MARGRGRLSGGSAAALHAGGDQMRRQFAGVTEIGAPVLGSTRGSAVEHARATRKLMVASVGAHEAGDVVRHGRARWREVSSPGVALCCILWCILFGSHTSCGSTARINPAQVC